MSRPEAPLTVERHDRVILVRIDDSESRNGLTPAFAAALSRVLVDAENDTAARVVLLTGTPTVFCTGATREQLRKLAAGEATMLADRIVDAPARCRLPVVAAMRGHALGGGLLLGLYADAAILSERSLYAANFMRHGFTPAMGAGHLLPARFGDVLGREMLLTGRGYRGHELARRSVQQPIVAHDDVEPAAFDLARSIAQAPRSSLLLTKRNQAAPLLAEAEKAIAAELTMHEITAALPDVALRIQSLAGLPAAEGERS